MQVGTMDDRVGIAEVLPEWLAHRYLGDLVTADAVDHDQSIDVDRVLQRPLDDSECLEGIEAVRCQLDTGADLTELLRALEHDHLEACGTQSDRGGKTSYAATRDDHAAAPLSG